MKFGRSSNLALYCAIRYCYIPLLYLEFVKPKGGRIAYGRLIGCSLISATLACCLVAYADDAMKKAPTNQTETETGGQKFVRIKLYEILDSTKKQRVLADPTCVAIPKQPFSFISGGEVNASGFEHRYNLELELRVKLDSRRITLFRLQ